MVTLHQEIQAELAKTRTRSSFPSDLMPINKLAGLNMQKGKEPENDLEKWKQEISILQKTLKQVKCTPKTPLRKQQINELGARIHKAIQKIHTIKEQLGMNKQPVTDINKCFVDVCRQKMPSELFFKYLEEARKLGEERTKELLKTIETKD